MSLQGAALLIALLAGSAAFAFGQGYPQQPAYADSQYGNNPAYQRGFQDGINDGRNDRGRGRNVNPTKTDHYEDTPGYDSSFGPKDQYKQLYRQAYISGYQQAVRQNYQNGYYEQRTYPAYGEPQYGSDPAYQRGFQDGINDGRNARQNGHDAEATKTEHYEDTPGYNSSYGEKNTYKQIYRRGYTAGFQQAFRYDDRNGGYIPRHEDNAAYQRGFQDGINDGRSDRERGRNANPMKTEHYEDTPGYDPSSGDKEQYKQIYRQAYTDGYQRAFERDNQNGYYGPPR